MENGIIKNNYSFGGAVRECIKISNGNSKVSIQCDYIEGLGGSDQSEYEGASIFVNANDGSEFNLTCNRVTNKNNAAIIIQNGGDSYLNKINILADLVETGLSGDSDTGSSAMIIDGGGFINVDEVVCRNYGSCLIHKRGTITANILKLTTNNSTSTLLPTVDVSGGDGTQNLTLYFDEIQNIGGGDTIKAAEGNVKLIGRRVYSNSGLSMDLSANFECQCVEIISGTKGINIHNSSTQKIIIEAEYIEGGIANLGVVKSAANSNYVLRDAKIKCTDTSSGSTCIYLPDGSTNDQTIEIENLILVTGNTSTGNTIYRDGLNTINVKNLGLFVNKGINRTRIILKIGTGTGTGENYKYIESSDIT